MQNKFEKILELVKMTGDKMVVVDKDCPDDGYVVMDIREYKQLVEDSRPWLNDDIDDEWDDCMDKSWELDEKDIYNEGDISTIDADDGEDMDDSYDGYMEDEDDDENIGITELGDNNEDSYTYNEEIPFPESDYAINNAEAHTELDNNKEYDNIEHTTKEGKNTQKLSKWQISEDIKNTGENPSPNSSFSEDDDRYYLETI